MGWKAIKVFFRQTYDDLFTLLVANALWFVLSIPVVTFPAATLSLYEFTYKLLRRQEEVEFRMMWQGVRKWFWRGLAVYALIFLSIVLPVTGMFFYASLAQKIGVLGYALYALCFWTLVFCLMAQLYLIPFILHQKLSLGMALKRSAMMVLYRPGMSLLMLLMMVLLWVLCVIPPFVFFLFLYAATAAMLKNTALLVGLEDYED